MIVTITLNPCIDKSTSVPEIKPEVKLRNTEPKNEPGGGGINVSKALAKLEVVSSALFPAGGHNGGMLKALLTTAKIPFRSVNTNVETRENWIVVESDTRRQFRFTFPGLEIETDTVKALLDELHAFSPSYVVASGSLPPGLPNNFYGLVVKRAKAAGARCIVDTSGDALKALEGKGAFLIKPNLNELARLLGLDHININEVDDAAQQLIQNGFAEIIAISLGSHGAWIVSASEKHLIRAPKVDVKTTVGAGDSMVAGITYMLHKNETLKNALRFGVCCGSAATMNAGTELFKVTDVWRLYKELE
ncbi:MAG: 1-phosphofructokinase family hexose kinase [Chitinophagaceae bacterium]